MIAQRLTVVLAATVFVMHAAGVYAQGAFPAPLPGQASAPAPTAAPPPMTPSAGAPAPSAFPTPTAGGFSAPTAGGPPPMSGGFGAPQQQAGAPSGGQQECQSGFVPLRADAEAKANAIKTAGKRRASPQEACKLIGAFSQAEVKMIKFVEANAKKCGIPPQVSEQMKKGHTNTEQMQSKVCAAAAGGGGGGPAAPSLSEALGSATLPEAKATKRSGGSTFDTLNGNVLAR